VLLAPTRAPRARDVRRQVADVGAAAVRPSHPLAFQGLLCIECGTSRILVQRLATDLVALCKGSFRVDHRHLRLPRHKLITRVAAVCCSAAVQPPSRSLRAPNQLTTRRRVPRTLEAIGNMSGVRGGDCKTTPRLLQYQAWLKRKSILLILVLALASRERQ
jgi:hypothetical protein